MNLNPIPKVKQFYVDSRRMFSIMYRPTTTEFKRTLKVVLLGILILGVLGYVISIIVNIIA